MISGEVKFIPGGDYGAERTGHFCVGDCAQDASLNPAKPVIEIFGGGDLKNGATSVDLHESATDEIPYRRGRDSAFLCRVKIVETIHGL